MTKLRNPLSYEHAIQRIMGQFSDAGAGALVNRSDSCIRKWADQDTDSLPTILQAEILDAAMEAETGETPLWDAYNARREMRNTKPQTRCMRTRVTQLCAEVGGVAREVHTALEDDKISEVERAQIKHAAQLAMNQLRLLLKEAEAA